MVRFGEATLRKLDELVRKGIITEEDRVNITNAAIMCDGICNVGILRKNIKESLNKLFSSGITVNEFINGEYCSFNKLDECYDSFIVTSFYILEGIDDNISLQVSYDGIEDTKCKYLKNKPKRKDKKCGVYLKLSDNGMEKLLSLKKKFNFNKTTDVIEYLIYKEEL